MLNNALLFLLQSLFGLLTLVFLLRFYFQLTKVSFQQQAAQVIITLTNFAVKPLRRIIPSVGKFDLSTLLLAYISQWVLAVSSLWLKGFPLLLADSNIWWIVFVIALLGVISMSTTIFMYAVLIQAILSWINPYTPIAPLLNNLTAPVLNFLRRFIPTAAGLDLTPLIFIITAQLLLTTILIPLENNFLLLL